ncbi:MAG: dTMP kinase [Desulfobaccales bacterium]
MSAAGWLVALEGVDGSGKTTQAQLLAEALEGRGLRVALTQEPSPGPAGQRLRRYLAGPTRNLSPAVELALFVADRREHVGRVIMPGLAAGQVVITDRYYYSSVAYQGALGLDPARILALNETFAPRPDLVFILTLDPGLAVARLTRQRQVTEDRDYLKRVAAIYASLRGPHIHRVDADAAPETIHAGILEITLKALERA